MAGGAFESIVIGLARILFGWAADGTLKRDNRRLREAINQRPNAELAHVPGGAVVYVESGPDNDTSTYFCPRCWNEQHWQPLQPAASEYDGRYRCPGCDRWFHVMPNKPLPPGRRRRSGWMTM